jgi:para-nitrobenzyl esterase
MSSLATIGQGDVEGFLDGGIHKFFGVPYAQAPVGTLRWRAPQPAMSWTGIRQAKAYGPACPQTVGAVFNLQVDRQSEDCLYLNVWTRTLDPLEKQPVMVWIHGGGFLGGAGSEDATDGSCLAARGVTVVSINYRLGAFGYLAHPDFGANFGVLDQVAALRWVQENIAAFGGDPGCVTIFGQSAGAHSVRKLLTSRYAQGLFHRAILQSGGFESPAFDVAWTYARTAAASKALVEQLGGGHPDDLRAIPTEMVKQASHQLCGVFPKPGKITTPASLVWVPVDDEDVLRADDGLGAMATVPVLMGFTSNEARYFLKPGQPRDEHMLETMTRVMGREQADALLLALHALDGDLYDRVDKMFTSSIWAEPALALARMVSAVNPRLYQYRFDRVSPGMRRSNELAKHTAEIKYVFGNLHPSDCYDDIDRSLSTWMQNAWIEFARTGAPYGMNGEPWPAYTLESELGLSIDALSSSVRLCDDPIVRRVHALRSRISQ